MFCGKGIPGKAPQSPSSRTIKETPPVGIDNIYFWLAGPTEVQKAGLFGADKVGRGFCAALSLVDTSGNWTTSDGQLVLALIRHYSHSMHQLLGADHSALHKVAKKAIFYKEINVNKGDFKWETFHNQSREWEELCYTYSHITPPLFIERYGYIYIHFWFMMPDGRLLYKTGNWVTWE